MSFTYDSGTGVFNETCTVLSYLVTGSNVTFTFSSSAWATTEGETATFAIALVGDPFTTVGVFTLPIDATQIWWNAAFLRGLRGSVTVRAEWWKINEAGVEYAGTRQTLDVVYSGDSYDQQFFTSKATPTGGLGRYRVQFQRRSAQVDENGADVVKLEELSAVRHYPTKTLPGVTVLRVTTKATLAATGFSDRKFNLRWTRHVRELTTNALGPSRNFARAIAHIWTIAGNAIGGLDTDALQAVNDEHGEDSPLLRFDGFEPRAAGVRTLLAHVDRFLPVHNLASLADLGAALRRPALNPASLLH